MVFYATINIYQYLSIFETVEFFVEFFIGKGTTRFAYIYRVFQKMSSHFKNITSFSDPYRLH